MASGKDGNSKNGFPDIDHRFRDMREQMNRDREAFFNDGGNSSTPTSSIFGRESPFFRNRPSFEEFRSASPGFRSGFVDPMEASRKSSAPSAKEESIPIRVVHEKHHPGDKHKYTSHNKTADLPSSNENSSPRVTRAHSEPPKPFNQSQKPSLKTKIPLGNLSEHSEHNLSTSASDPSVPSTEQPQKQPQAQAQQPPQQNEPAIRHIPIFVEGREKPVLNSEEGIKKPSDFYPPNVKVERRSQNPPSSLKVNNLKEPQKQEPTSPLSPIPSDQPIPMGYTETDNAINGQEPTSPQPMPAGPIPMPCSPNFMNKKEPSPPKQEQQQPPAPPPPPPARKLDPNDPCLQQLFKIQDNVNDLVNQLEEFKGDKNSKEYRYLDEMLTRNLLALDGIETGGRDDVRQARKESINAINRCLSVLEAKAKTPDAEQNNEILSELAKKSSQQ